MVTVRIDCGTAITIVVAVVVVVVAIVVTIAICWIIVVWTVVDRGICTDWGW
jgi:hypothetical protein